MMPVPLVIGHRGAAGEAPENTLAGFDRAARAGLAMVEFDVRLAADGVAVVVHDDTLERTTDGRGPVAARTLAELKTLDAGSWFGPGFAGERIPSLDEALARCLELGLAVNLEIKSEPGREAETARIALERALALWPGARPPPLVSSFARPALAVAQDLAPRWPRGLLVEALPPDWREAARRLGCAGLCAGHAGLDAAGVAEIRREGLAVLAYTVNDEAEANRLWRAGVASVFGDFPTMMTKW